MHNRPRPPPDAPRDAAAEAKLAKKCELYRALSRKVLSAAAAGARSEAAWAAAGSLAELNPDCYTAWALRKRCHLALVHANSDAERTLVADEKRLTEAALRRNPKAYSAWLHRRWLSARTLAAGDAARELLLCNAMLDADERNFHCWGYRRFVVSLASGEVGGGPGATDSGEPTAASELAYARRRIAANFSNYSAWHARSANLTELEASTAGGGGEDNAVDVDAEFELVKGAFFTDPEDQSAFFYYRWLIGRTLRAAAVGASGTSAGIAAEVLEREVASIRELLEMEPDSKWASLTLARLQAARAALPGCDEREAQAMKAETARLLDGLARSDPMRAGYYASSAEAPWESQAAALCGDSTSAGAQRGRGSNSTVATKGVNGAVPSFEQREAVRRRLAANIEAMVFFSPAGGAAGGDGAPAPGADNNNAYRDASNADVEAEARDIEAMAALGAASSGGGYTAAIAADAARAVARRRLAAAEAQPRPGGS
eukprot:PRCOL_00003254-RA